jgi:hypothetical protein
VLGTDKESILKAGFSDPYHDRDRKILEMKRKKANISND